MGEKTAATLIWSAIVYGTCTYIVFWMGYSGWWYLLAIIIAGGIKFTVARPKGKP